MRVGFIGLGIMGSGMAANVLAKGHPLTVWNRTPARAAALRAAGAGWSQTPRALASEVEVVCVCVADPPALRAVAAGQGQRQGQGIEGSDGSDGFLSGLSPGSLVIDFSTVGPETGRWLDRECRARGAHFLEAPVTGSKNAAAAGTLLVMCGGTMEAFAAAQPVLTAVSAKAIHVGEAAGQAAKVKLIGNVMIAHMVEALSEGAALASHGGIALEKVLEVVQSSGFASPFWEFKGKALMARDFSTHFAIDLMHKDLTLALRQADALGVALPATAAIREVYQMARARGHGQEDIIATAGIIDPQLRGSTST